MKNLKEIASISHRCVVGTCPSVFREGDQFFVIGKTVQDPPEEVKKKVGPDEQVVLVPLELIRDLKEEDLK